jgi:dihydroceramide fatty acyl 2-hydroxylase
VCVADWSKPQPGQAPMFQNALLERLSVVHPALPTAIYLPLGLYLLWRSAAAGFGIAAIGYIGGLLIWSLLEYGAHRGAFHHEPHTPSQLAYAYLVHGVHHAYPEDSRRWMMPVVVTLPVAAVVFVIFKIILGMFAVPAFGGLVHGYLTYDLIHYFVHRGRVPTRFGRFLRRYHLAHHFSTPDRKFGVSSPIWDAVFRTR